MMDQDRADIAAAANQIDGLNIVGHYRQHLKPRDGFVKWNGRTPDDSGLGWIDTWQVWVVLAQDVKAAEEWIAANVAPLIAAVQDEIVVTGAIPAELLLGNKTVNGLIIEGTRLAA